MTRDVWKKGTAAFCAVVLWQMVFLSAAQSVPVTLDDPLCRSLQATGAEMDEFYIAGTATLRAASCEPEALAAMVSKAAEFLEIPAEGRNYEWELGERTRSLRLIQSDAQQKIEISAECGAVCDEAATVRLKVQIVRQVPDEKEIRVARKKIERTFSCFRTTPRITACLQGHIDGKLRKDVWDSCMQDAMDAISARRVTATCDKYYVSYAGFSPLLKEEIKVSEATINLNIAMRYNDFKRCTEVFVASPVIAVEY